jgi:hypothetical protein
VGNEALGQPGGDLLTAFDAIDQLGRIASPTLVSVGAVDAVTPVDCSREIVDGLPAGLGRLSVLDGAGHFPGSTPRTATSATSGRSSPRRPGSDPLSFLSDAPQASTRRGNPGRAFLVKHDPSRHFHQMSRYACIGRRSVVLCPGGVHLTHAGLHRVAAVRDSSQMHLRRARDGEIEAA